MTELHSATSLTDAIYKIFLMQDASLFVTCLIVIAGFHPSSSFRMERQTVPDG